VARSGAMTALVRPTARLRRDQAMELLARGLPPSDVAAQLGVSLRTLRRYLDDGEILDELRRAQTERIEALLRASLQVAPQPLLTLHEVAADPGAEAHARAAAARAILGREPDDDPPYPPGDRLSDMAREGWPCGQKAPPTDKNPRFALPAILRRLLPSPRPLS